MWALRSGLVLAQRPDMARAKRRKKPKFNDIGCLEVGEPCAGKDSRCCSGICRGKKGEEGHGDVRRSRHWRLPGRATGLRRHQRSLHDKRGNAAGATRRPATPATAPAMATASPVTRTRTAARSVALAPPACAVRPGAPAFVTVSRPRRLHLPVAASRPSGSHATGRRLRGRRATAPVLLGACSLARNSGDVLGGGVAGDRRAEAISLSACPRRRGGAPPPPAPSVPVPVAPARRPAARRWRAGGRWPSPRQPRGRTEVSVRRPRLRGRPRRPARRG